MIDEGAEQEDGNVMPIDLEQLRKNHHGYQKRATIALRRIASADRKRCCVVDLKVCFPRNRGRPSARERQQAEGLSQGWHNTLDN